MVRTDLLIPILTPERTKIRMETCLLRQDIGVIPWSENWRAGTGWLIGKEWICFHMLSICHVPCACSFSLNSLLCKLVFCPYWTITQKGWSQRQNWCQALKHQTLSASQPSSHMTTMSSLELIYLLSVLRTFCLILEGSSATLAVNNTCSGQ